MAPSPENACRTPRPLHVQQRRLRRLVGLAVVDEHRQVVRGGERELPLEDIALDVGRRQVAVVVEPDLADGPRARIAGKPLEMRPGRPRRGGGVVRMDTDRGVEEVGMAAARASAASDEARSQPGTRMRSIPASGTLEHRLAVGIEALVLEVGVRVDDPRQALRARRRLRPRPPARRAGRSAWPCRSPLRGPAAPRRQRGQAGPAGPALVVGRRDAELLVDAARAAAAPPARAGGRRSGTPRP